MTSLIDTLPGISLPVSQVMDAIARMWEFDSPNQDNKYSQFRATQMNLILHFGSSTAPKDALKQFKSAIDIAQYYPCRIVVLCPNTNLKEEHILTAKLYSQCYVGETLKDTNCCEALIISYLENETTFLNNQVSIWLDNDLPTYHWFHRVESHRLTTDYLSFLRNCQRAIFDSSIEDDGFQHIDWPKALTVKDLAGCRMLNARQIIGQFLSTYDPCLLIDKLEHVIIEHPDSHCAEALSLLRWQRACLDACKQHCGKLALDIIFKTKTVRSSDCIHLIWKYEDSKYFEWTYCIEAGNARVKAFWGRDTIDYPVQIKKLRAKQTLIEAIFH